MNTPSVARISSFLGVSPDCARMIKSLMNAASHRCLLKERVGEYPTTSDVMTAINSELSHEISVHGEEPIRSEGAWDNFYGDVIAVYINRGDTYDPTILFDCQNHRFHLTSWGDWYEKWEMEREKEER